ncbi:MAG: serine hydrolase [Chitinophagaceae bacterium]
MKSLKKIFLAIIFFSLICSRALPQQATSVSPYKAQPVSVVIDRLEKDIPQLMKEADIPGLSAALIRNGKLAWRKNFGVANAETNEPVTDETIFEAASLSKIVTAYAALQLVDQGKLDLDKPLNQYLGNNYDAGDDKRINLITARHVLTHSTGFPNWRPRDSTILPILFTPGEKFSYSGEGFVYLSKVIEKISSMKFDEYIKKNVLVPLQMTHSNFSWLDSYKKLHVYRHDGFGKKSFRPEQPGYNAAASLRTTAEDYAKFVIAILKGTGLKKATSKQMLSSQIIVNNEKAPFVSWGLGLGLETNTNGKTFWHWGDQGDSKCYITAFIEPQDAIVYFTNSRNGLSITHSILEDAIGGEHPALAWLNYERYNPAAKNLLHAINDKGAVAALKEYRQFREQNKIQALQEAAMNTIGYQVLQSNKVDDAIEIFKQNTIDFPQSGNAWDSLAEAYMINGNKERAIEYYEKSLKLDPGNSNAVEQLKKLKS